MFSTDFSFQMFGFVASIAGGVILGACYDVLRIWRIFFHTQRRTVFFQDFFYMAFAALFTFLLSLPLGAGEVRLYILIGEILGFFTYYYTVGQITSRFFGLISNFLYKYLFYPIKRAVIWTFAGLSKVLYKLILKSKKCLKSNTVVVYNYINRCTKNRKKGALMYESSKKAKS